MGEELREFCRLDDVPLHISKTVIAESLDNLRHVEKGHINRMMLQCTHCILNNVGVVSVGR